MEQLLSILPDEHARQIRRLGLDQIEEIRVTAGQALLLRRGEEEVWLKPVISGETVEEILRRACRQSVYAHKETLRQGFVTLDGGHRVGLCGTGVVRDGHVDNLVQPSSLMIRLARQVRGCADGLIAAASRSMLLIGPPCGGKTTLLRDLVRQLSDKRRQRVSLVDERGEVAAMLQGRARLDVGTRTDVLVNIPKSEAIMMLLRTMNPQWIAVDEITAPEDVRALEQASYCGVKLLATAHASVFQDLYQRPLYRGLMQAGMFQTIVELKPDRSYTIREVHG